MAEIEEFGQCRSLNAAQWLLAITVIISLVLGVIFTDAFSFRLSTWSEGFLSKPPVHDTWHAIGEKITTICLGVAGIATNISMLVYLNGAKSSQVKPSKAFNGLATTYGIIGLLFCFAMLLYSGSMY